MPHLFEPFTLRGVTLRNRIAVSPMCQYSSDDGYMNDWHLVHLGSRAVGGAGLVMTEATAVTPDGRISPNDAGIYHEQHVEMLFQITKLIKAHGAVPGIQLAHAGRKGSTARPWEGTGAVQPEKGGWIPLAPSAVAFEPEYPMPSEMTLAEIQSVQEAFVTGAKRSLAAGFEWIELHFAHGYLAHQFLSPLANRRTDRYGSNFDNRIRFAVETARAVRAVWPDHLALTARVSATDWAPGGWDLNQTVELARWLKEEGVDLIDCSSGGMVPDAVIPVGAGYQVPFAEAVKHEAEIPTAAVGMITEPAQADEIIRNGRADIVMLARQMLRDPYWAYHAAQALHVKPFPAPPVQYGRAFG